MILKLWIRIGILAVSAAVLVGISGILSPLSRADGYGYLQHLNNHGINVTDVGMALQLGNAICIDMSRGYTGVEEATTLYQKVSWATVDNAIQIVIAAVENLCPAYYSRLNPGGAA